MKTERLLKGSSYVAEVDAERGVVIVNTPPSDLQAGDIAFMSPSGAVRGRTVWLAPVIAAAALAGFAAGVALSLAVLR